MIEDPGRQIIHWSLYSILNVLLFFILFLFSAFFPKMHVVSFVRAVCASKTLACWEAAGLSVDVMTFLFLVVLFSRNILVLSYTFAWIFIAFKEMLYLRFSTVFNFQRICCVFCCCYDYYHHCFQFCMGLFNVYLMWKCKNLFISFSTKTRWRWATTWNPTDVEHFFFLCTDASVFGTEYLVECATLIPITFFCLSRWFSYRSQWFFFEKFFLKAMQNSYAFGFDRYWRTIFVFIFCLCVVDLQSVCE